MPEFLFIINPVSGRGAGSRAIPSIEKFISQYALDAQILQSDFPGHAIQIATKQANNVKTIVAVGGDGTANEVINGLLLAKSPRSQLPALAILSVGRGNDFAFGAGIPIGLDKGLNTLLDSRVKPIDIGLIKGGDYPNGRFFGNGVGIGFDAVVGFVAAKSKLTGFLSYIIAAIKTIFIYYSAPTVELSIQDKQLNLPALMISVMNGKRMGGGFYMAPQASNQDGLFDICIANEVPKRRILSLIPYFLRGDQFTQPEIQFYRSAFLRAKATHGTLPVHADGETICVAGQEVTIEIIPQALDLWTPLR